MRWICLLLESAHTFSWHFSRGFITSLSPPTFPGFFSLPDIELISLVIVIFTITGPVRSFQFSSMPCFFLRSPHHLKERNLFSISLLVFFALFPAPPHHSWNFHIWFRASCALPHYHPAASLTYPICFWLPTLQLANTPTLIPLSLIVLTSCQFNSQSPHPSFHS